jgi:hypothetical protein
MLSLYYEASKSGVKRNRIADVFSNGVFICFEIRPPPLASCTPTACGPLRPKAVRAFSARRLFSAAALFFRAVYRAFRGVRRGALN